MRVHLCPPLSRLRAAWRRRAWRCPVCRAPGRGGTGGARPAIPGRRQDRAPGKGGRAHGRRSPPSASARDWLPAPSCHREPGQRRVEAGPPPLAWCPGPATGAEGRRGRAAGAWILVVRLGPAVRAAPRGPSGRAARASTPAACRGPAAAAAPAARWGSRPPARPWLRLGPGAGASIREARPDPAAGVALQGRPGSAARASSPALRGCQGWGARTASSRAACRGPEAAAAPAGPWGSPPARARLRGRLQRWYPGAARCRRQSAGPLPARR
mmetsp:Transcript_104113/g.324613  ORF Transcript_104113/g.324613 Transcript_104113/m.324613 type:complete len:270 (+) Transcript_104113:14-823(+)